MTSRPASYPVAVVGVGNMGGAMAARLLARMTLLEKDTRLAQQAAQEAGYTGPLGAAAAQVFARASAAGLADLDDAAVLRWLEMRQ